MPYDAQPELPATLQEWNLALRPFRIPDDKRAAFELAITFIPFVALWFGSWWAFDEGLLWLSALISFPAAAFLVRLFMIQHDCGHQALIILVQSCMSRRALGENDAEHGAENLSVLDRTQRGWLPKRETLQTLRPHWR